MYYLIQLNLFCCFFNFFKGRGFTVIFLKLDFKMAVDQNTKACDLTFEVPDSGCPPLPAGLPCPLKENCGQIFLKA